MDIMSKKNNAPAAQLPKGFFTVGILQNLIKGMTVFSLSILASVLVIIFGKAELPPEPSDILQMGLLGLFFILRIKSLADMIKTASEERKEKSGISVKGTAKFVSLLIADIAAATAVTFLLPDNGISRIGAAVILLLWILYAFITQLIMDSTLRRLSSSDNEKAKEFAGKLYNRKED